MNGGSLDSKTAIIPPWPRAYEAKANGWRATVHVPTMQMWNRHNEPLTIADEFKEALLCLRDFHSEFTWLDCECLSRRHKLGKGALIVLDIIDYGDLYNYVVRRAMIEKHFNMLPDNPKVWPDSVWRLPSFTGWVGSWPEAIWKILQEENKRLGLTGENVMWEGLVCKRLDSKYNMQLVGSDKESSSWVKHRFI